jgi:predicted transcriptional regulator
LIVKYRHRISIIADIVKATEKFGKKTRIMYFANLSYKLLQKYLDETINAGFINTNNNSYEVTEKGRAFLKKYKSYNRRYSRVQKTHQNLIAEREKLEKMCGKSSRNAKSKVKRKRTK